MAHRVESLLKNLLGKPMWHEGFLTTPLPAPPPPWTVKERSTHLCIQLTSPPRLGYFETSSRSYRAGRSPDGFRSEWNTNISERFVEVSWDEHCNELLPEGFLPPPPPKAPPPPTCELCDTVLRPALGPRFPANHRTVRHDGKTFQLCLTCCAEWDTPRTEEKALTRCEVCESKFTPPPRYVGHPAHYREPPPGPKNRRTVWDQQEGRELHLCVECAQEWKDTAPQ